MLYYPQLTTGSISQYPVVRTNQRRSVTNVLADGSDFRMEDAGAAQVSWDLSYSNLTLAEVANLQTLFEAVEGRLGTFTFVDPTDNLLTWSEDLLQSSWTADPLIGLNSGIQDPFGSAGAVQLTNTAQIAQRLGQTISSASWFVYCFSAYLRSDTSCTVQFVSASASEQHRKAVAVGTSWERALAPVLLGSTEDGIYFGVEIPPGCRVALFGPQVEAQLGAGSYKNTTDRAGVYSAARFDMDKLTQTTTGLGQHSCSVRVTSGVAG